MTMYSGKRKMATCRYSAIAPIPLDGYTDKHELVAVCAMTLMAMVLRSEFPCLVCQDYERDPHKCPPPERRKGTP